VTKSEPPGPVFVGLMPHAPVLIPDVGRGRENDAIATVNAMRALADRLLARKPELLVVLSPHSPRRPGAFGIWLTPRIGGDLARFGCPDVTIDLPNDQTIAYQLGNVAESHHVSTWNITGQQLDHGASVPLWFLTRAGWDGPTAVVGLNYPREGQLDEMARAIADTLAEDGRRTAVLASGDMSHALAEGGPAGFHPRAAEFDQVVTNALRAGDCRSLRAINPELQELAAEDVVDSTLIAAAIADWRNEGHELLSYQCPFGVGYSVATIHETTTS